MKISGENRKLGAEIFGYMLEMGKASKQKNVSRISFVKNKISTLLNDADAQQISEVIEFGKQLKVEVGRGNDSDKEIRLSGISEILNLLDFKSVEALGDELNTLNKEMAKATPKELKKVEVKVEMIIEKIETVVVSCETISIEIVNSLLVPQGRSKKKLEEVAFRENPAFQNDPSLSRENPFFNGQLETSVVNLRDSADELSDQVSKENEAELPSPKKMQHQTLQKLSARLTVIGIYLKSIKEHLNPLKPRVELILNIELKERILEKLETAMDKEKENPLKLEIFQNSIKKLSKPRPEKAKVSGEKLGFFAKKAKTEKAKKKGKTQSPSIELVDEGFEPEITKSRRGKAGRKGGGGSKMPPTL